MKKQIAFYGLLLFSLLFSASVFAQDLKQFRGRLKKQQPTYKDVAVKDKFYKAPANGGTTPIHKPEFLTCETMEADSALRAKYPEMKSLEEEEVLFQRQIQEYLAQNALLEIITIPVIVHIIHNGESVGTGTNLSQAQVQSQIDVLNEDFRRMGAGANNHPDGADIEIEFALAVEDPLGNPLPEPGINRVNGGRFSWEVGEIQGIVKPQTQWDPLRYFNIWTVRFGTPGLGGYAQFPSLSGLDGLEQNGGLAQTDGVVLNYQNFGRGGSATPPYDLGRVTTHEVGHWLGLRHVWGDGDCSVDDFCADTPLAGQPNTSCVINDSCPGSPGNDMIENYMDYTPDACRNVFTNDQKTRIRTVLMNSPRRRELKDSDVDTGSGNPNGAPVAQFTADKTGACVGQTIRFTDQSTNNPTSREWRFFDEADNLLATFNGPIQDIIFNIPGVYSVELIVANSLGQDSYFAKNLIGILSDQLYNEYAEDFEDPNNALLNWLIFNPDADRTFALTNVSSYGVGTGGLIFDNYSVSDDPSGKVDVLISPALNLNGAVNPYFYFEHAYASFNAAYSDTLVLYYSLDCGQTFEPFWFKGGAELATAPATTESFVPTNQQWTWNQVSLSPLAGNPSVHIAIANLSGWGNNLYMDKIAFFDGFNYTAGPVVSSFYTARTQICEGDIIQFQDYSSNYPSQWLWQFEGGFPNVSNVQHPFVLYNTPGLYDVSFQAANLFGGDGGFTVTDLIEVVPLPNVNLSADQAEICPGDLVTLTAGGASTYEWYDETSGSPIYVGNTFEITLYESNTFTVVGFNQLGCQSEVSLLVEVNPADPSCQSSLLVSPVVYLQGAYEPVEGLMRDALRVNNLTPLNEPYTALGYAHIGGGGENTTQTIFNLGGADAIVDWVFLELRDKSDHTIVLATRSALLQRDGDVVDVDGVSPVAFADLPADDYYLAVKHRNHMGAMVAAPLSLSSTTTVVDFTSAINNIYGATNGIATLEDGSLGLFSGDFDRNGQVQNTDFSSMIFVLGTAGYEPGDLDLNGQVQNTDLQLKLLPNIGKGQPFGL